MQAHLIASLAVGVIVAFIVGMFTFPVVTAAALMAVAVGWLLFVLYLLIHDEVSRRSR